MVKQHKTAPAITVEAAENQLISLAMEQARYQLENKIAPASTVNYYLQLASSKDKLEIEKKEKEIELLKAKVRALESQSDQENSYKEAVKAMTRYRSSENEL